MSYYDGYPQYVTVAEKRALAKKSMEKIKKKNPQVAPVVIVGSKLAQTWWGKAWNANLERYSDYANRIGRGRSYVRHGAVLDLRLTPGKVEALVQGSRANPYHVQIDIAPLRRPTWERITTACGGAIQSLPELLEGKFPKALATLFTAQGEGLFPTPKEITLNCSCPDWAVMCKHVAAALYGIGARLDDNPALFFALRQVTVEELVSKAVAEKSEALLKKSATKSRRVIDGRDDDLGALFGIDLDPNPDGEAAPQPKKAPSRRKPSAGNVKGH